MLPTPRPKGRVWAGTPRAPQGGGRPLDPRFGRAFNSPAPILLFAPALSQRKRPAQRATRSENHLLSGCYPDHRRSRLADRYGAVRDTQVDVLMEAISILAVLRQHCYLRSRRQSLFVQVIDYRFLLHDDLRDTEDRCLLPYGNSRETHSMMILEIV